MCNVIGYHPIAPEPDRAKEAFARLFREGSIRGLHAFGICAHDEPFRSFNQDEVIERFDPTKPTIAHARYCTSGDWRVLENNQPLVLDDVALVFNGVIDMGTKAEMKERWDVFLSTDNDGEIFLRCLERGEDPDYFIGRIQGSFAGCWLDGDDTLWVGRNERRPLWRAQAYGATWYASTRDIFARAGFPMDGVKQVPVGVEQADCCDLG